VSFSASGHDPDGAIVSYQWTFGDGGTASGAGPTHVYTAPGAYNVSVTITDSDGRHVTANGSINVSPDENPTAGLFAASGTAGAPVAFSGFGSDPDGSIVSFTWNFGDGGTGTGATPSHVYAAAGTYTVTVTVTDSAGRTASASEAVTITKISHPLPNCVAPKLKGKTLAKAKRLLKSAHCGLGSVKTPRKPKRSAGHHHKWELLVSHQSVAPGRSKPNGTKISLKLTWAAVKTH
jgi:PKD repeat protein